MFTWNAGTSLQTAAWCHNPEANIINLHYCDNPKSYSYDVLISFIMTNVETLHILCICNEETFVGNTDHVHEL
jgi:hypothetical protein